MSKKNKNTLCFFKIELKKMENIKYALVASKKLQTHLNAMEKMV